MKITTITIDPGVRGTGVALWIPQAKEPVKTYLFEPYAKDAWSVRLGYICDRLEDCLYKNKPKEAIIEQPVFMRSREGIGSAASGNLVKLAMIAGALFRVCLDYGCDTNTVFPARWKGRRSKDTVETAIRKILPNLKAKNHNVIDAVGIGLWHKGYLKAGVRIR